MNQHKKRAMLWILLLSVCVGILGSCIHPDEGDFRTSPPDVTLLTPPEVTAPTTPPEVGTTEAPITEVTTPAQTTPPETTQTTPPVTTPIVTTTPPVETTTPEPEPPKPPEPEVKIKIYIDQGHNPFSPTHPPSWNTGASNEELGLYEQDITFEIGMLLADLLLQDNRFEIRLSRPTAETILGTDNDSALDARVNDATAWGADYFISLHTNSFNNSSVNGLEVYVADGDTRGYDLGHEILDELIKSTGLRSRGMKDGSDLRVLKNATMPATLVEMGFISNEDDAILLRDNPELFAQGIFEGIKAYFDALEEEPTSTEQE